jgi:hypothetical protein
LLILLLLPLCGFAYNVFDDRLQNDGDEQHKKYAYKHQRE